MHLFHIPECSIQNRNVHISVLNGAFWYMEQVHSGICEIGLFKCASISYHDYRNGWAHLKYKSSIKGMILSHMFCKLTHWSLLLTEICKTSIDFSTWIKNYTHIILWDVITHPCPNINCVLLTVYILVGRSKQNRFLLTDTLVIAVLCQPINVTTVGFRYNEVSFRKISLQ